MNHKPALGKGLGSLFPGAQLPNRPPQFASAAQSGSQAESSTPTTGAGAVAAGPVKTIQPETKSASEARIPGITHAMIEEITANEFQPRRGFHDETLEELAQSIRKNGIIQPLIVRKTTKGYELIAGERRLRAAKIAGLKQVPIVVRRSTDRESLELALIENIQREDLNCIDTALAYNQLAEEFSLTQEEIAERVGKDRATVANHLRLLKLPEQIITDLKSAVLTFGHGKAILAIDGLETRLKVRNEVIAKKLSVRETEALISKISEAKKAADQGNAPDGTDGIIDQNDQLKTRLRNLSLEISRALGCKAEIKGGPKGAQESGKIVLHYSSRDQLEHVLEYLK